MAEETRLMRLAVRKLPVAHGAALADLLSEHLDGIEPGLSVIDARLILGEAMIDLVARDVAAGLVLIALGTSADESMLLRVADAYSWGLEYPESLKRRYPGIDVSEENPPRVIFLMPRLSESFQRKVKQLYFPAIDAVEFHHLDIDGQSTVYFDNVVRIRRGVDPARSAATVAPRRAVDIDLRPQSPALAHPERPSFAAVVAEAAAAAASPAWAISGASDATGLLEVPAAMDEPVFIPIVDEPVESVAAQPVDEPAAGEPMDRLIAAEPVDDPIATEPLDEPVTVAEAITPATPAPAPAVEAPAATEAAKDRRGPSGGEAVTAAKIAEELGIQLPVGRGLTRQWIEFLNQLAAAK
jgi:hypothetical protein